MYMCSFHLKKLQFYMIHLTHTSISHIDTSMHSILVATHFIYGLWSMLFIRGSGFRGRDCEAEDAGLLHELSQFCGHLKERRAKHAAVLHTGSDGRGTGTSCRPSLKS